MSGPPFTTTTVPGVRAFRVLAALTFAFGWIPVMYTAFTVDRGFTPTQYFELWSAYYLAMVLAELPWGWAADRWGTRPLLVAGPLWMAICFVVLGEADSFATCWIAMAATGVGHAMISGTDSAYLYQLLSRHDQRHRALHEEAVAHRWRLFGVSIIDVLGGFTAFWFGTRSSFHASAAIMVLAAIVATRMPALPAPRVATGRPAVLTAASALRRSGVIWVLCWYMAVFVLLRVGFQLYQPTLLAVHIGDLRLHGLMLGGLNLVAGLSAILVMRTHTRFGERPTAAFVLLLLGLSFLGLSQLGAGVLFPLFCLQQVAFGFLQPIGRTALNHRIPPADRAALLSLQSMLARLGFGLLLFGFRGDEAFSGGLGNTYLVLAGATGLIALTLYLAHPRAASELETTHTG